MTSPFIFSGSGFDMAAQLRKRDQACKMFTQAANAFLQDAYPHADTGLIYRLCESFRALMCLGIEDQIKSLEKARPYSDDQMLINAIKGRDALTSQIEMADAALASFPAIPDGPFGPLKVMYEAMLIAPMRQRLDAINDQISRIQEQIESRMLQSANGGQSQPVTRDEKSANEKEVEKV